jgi:tetratricopeptide (TPR) repeat protein
VNTSEGSLPDQTALVTSAEGIMNAYVRTELQPKIADVQRQIRNAPASQQAALYNQLGSLQLRTGNMADAKASYERAAGMGSLAGMLNRGSVAMTEKDYTAAARWFNQALALQPDNEIAKRGLAQITEERRN